MGWLTKIDLGLKDLDFSEADLELELDGKPPLNGVFGPTPADQLLSDFDRGGLLEPLRARGYLDFRPQLERSSFSSERFRLLGHHPGHSEALQLLDMKSRQMLFQAPSGARHSVLSWEWLELQDPAARPAPQKPLLPGQKHPGLGWYRTFLQVMRGYIQRLQVQAVVATPMFFHNAVFLGPEFHFVDPVRQGGFQAMCRDLLPKGIASASWGVFQKDVVMFDRESGQATPFLWEAALCLHPLSPELQTLTDSESYRSVSRRTAERLEFRYLDRA
jgi:hypothetical protein